MNCVSYSPSLVIEVVPVEPWVQTLLHHQREGEEESDVEGYHIQWVEEEATAAGGCHTQWVEEEADEIEAIIFKETIIELDEKLI